MHGPVYFLEVHSTVARPHFKLLNFCTETLSLQPKTLNPKPFAKAMHIGNPTIMMPLGLLLPLIIFWGTFGMQAGV